MPRIREEKDTLLQESYISGLVQQIKLQELEIGYLKQHHSSAADAPKKKVSVEK